jgi:lipoprotein-releasing system permease protein
MFQLAYSPASARNEAARLSYTISKENLSSQSAALKEAEALLTLTQNVLRFDSLQFSWHQNLYKQDALSRVELNKAKLAYDNTHASTVSSEWEETFGYTAEDWETANSTYLTGLMIRNIMTWSVSITLLIVAGFGIYNIMSMTIMNKMKDIAILKAMGFSAGDVLRMFLMQSLVIGFMGSLLGLCIGFMLSLLIAQVPLDGGDFFSLDKMPVRFDIRFYLAGILFGLITPAIAGFMPAKKAGIMDPIEILRN